jgi:hypothetical protein
MCLYLGRLAASGHQEGEAQEGRNRLAVGPCAWCLGVLFHGDGAPFAARA